MDMVLAKSDLARGLALRRTGDGRNACARRIFGRIEAEWQRTQRRAARLITRQDRLPGRATRAGALDRATASPTSTR
jgi:phosphoenolpyruvate carboxylase